MPATADPMFLRVDLLARIEGLRHGFTTRRAGTSRLAGGELADRLGLAGCRMVALQQVHGSRVVRIGQSAPGEPTTPADAAVTRLHRTVLTVRTADCVPILVADPDRRALGAAHAGWRGTALGIAAGLVRAMGDAFRCRPRDLRVGVGPAVGPCCYTVGDEVRRAFADQGRDIAGGDFLPGSDGRLRLNLPAAVIRQLLGAGIPAGNIETIALCTACRSDLLFSRRRDGPTPDRMHAFIAWTD